MNQEPSFEELAGGKVSSQEVGINDLANTGEPSFEEMVGLGGKTKPANTNRVIGNRPTNGAPSPAIPITSAAPEPTPGLINKIIPQAKEVATGAYESTIGGLVDIFKGFKESWSKGDLPKMTSDIVGLVAGGLVTFDPSKGFTDGGIGSETGRNLSEAKDSLLSGNPMEALANVSEAIPWIGPMLENMDNIAKEGHIAKALGHGIGIVAFTVGGHYAHGISPAKILNAAKEVAQRFSKVAKDPAKVNPVDAPAVIAENKLAGEEIVKDVASKTVAEQTTAVVSKEIKEIKDKYTPEQAIEAMKTVKVPHLSKEELITQARAYLEKQKRETQVIPSVEPTVPLSDAEWAKENAPDLAAYAQKLADEKLANVKVEGIKPNLQVRETPQVLDQMKIIKTSQEERDAKKAARREQGLPDVSFVDEAIAGAQNPEQLADAIGTKDVFSRTNEFLKNYQSSYEPSIEEFAGVDKAKEIVVEPNVELDTQLGNVIPESLATENHPLRQPSSGIYKPIKSVATDVDDLRLQLPDRTIKDPSTTLWALVDDVNAFLDGKPGVDIEGTKNFLTELAANTEEFRHRFIGQDYPQSFMDWSELVNDAADWAGQVRAKDKFDPSLWKGQEGFADISDLEIAVNKVKGGVNVGVEAIREFNRSMKLKDFSLAKALKNAKRESLQALWEHSETLVKQLRKSYPAESVKAIEAFRAVPMGPNYGTYIADRTLREIARGKSREQINLVKAGVTIRRFNDIYGYRPNYKAQKGYGPEQVAGIVQVFNEVKNMDDVAFEATKAIPEMKEVFGNLTRQQVLDSIQGMDDLFNFHRKMVDDMVEAGIKSPAEGEKLKSHDFTKFRSMNVEDVYDAPRKDPSDRSIKFANSGVERLDSGSANIIESDPFVTARESAARVYGAIANEAAKQEFARFAERNPDNEFVRIKLDDPSPEGWNRVGYIDKKGDVRRIDVDGRISKWKEFAGKQMDLETSKEFNKFLKEDGKHEFTKLIKSSTTIPDGWEKMPYHVLGEEKGIWFNPKIVPYLVTSTHDLSPRFVNAISTLTAAKVTKKVAVGLNPVWSATAGFAMDYVHALGASRTWEVNGDTGMATPKYPMYKTVKGKYKSVYSPFVPGQSLKLGLDIARTAGDTFHQGPLFQLLARNGLQLAHLSDMESNYFKNFKVGKELKSLHDSIASFGTKMEYTVRVAVADRVMRQQAKKYGLSYEQALKNKDIISTAIYDSNDRMNYSQGGWFVKTLDRSGINFLSVGITGFRTYYRAMADNPLEFGARTAKIALIAAGIASAAWILYPEVAKDIPEEGNARNVTFPLMPSLLNAIDKNGNTVYFYAKVRSDPAPMIMYKAFEHLTRKELVKMGLSKYEPDSRTLVNMIESLGPVDVRLQPALQAYEDYTSNYKPLWDENIVKEKLPYPASQYEGLGDKNLSPLAVGAGKITKWSPPRMQEAFKDIIPQSNEFVQLMGYGIEKAFGEGKKEVDDQVKEVARNNWMITLAKSPGFNRFIGVTQPGYHDRKRGEQLNVQTSIDDIVRTAEEKRVIGSYVDVDPKDKEAKSAAYKEWSNLLRTAKDEAEAKGLQSKMAYYKEIKNVPESSFWRLLYDIEGDENRAKVYVERYSTASPEMKKRLYAGKSKMAGLGRIVTQGFNEEVGKLESKIK